MDGPRRNAAARFEIRPLRDADAEPIVALYASAMATERGIGPVTAAQWRHFITLPQFGSGKDFRVALDGPRLVGLAESSLRMQGSRRVRFVKIVVDPALRRLGLGTTLIRTVVETDDAAIFHGLVPDHWTAGLAFLARLGFTRIETEATMLCEALQLPVRRPVGDLVCSFAPEPHLAAPRLAEIYNTAFAGDLSFARRTADDMLRQCDGAELWTACLAGEIVGFCLIEPEGQGSWLEILAVAPAQANRGIGTALAAEALKAREISRTSPCGLSAANPTAMRIYERLGFVVRGEKARFSAHRDDLVMRLGPPA